MIHLRDRHPEARSKRREDPGFTEIKKLIIAKNCKLSNSYYSYEAT